MNEIRTDFRLDEPRNVRAVTRAGLDDHACSGVDAAYAGDLTPFDRMLAAVRDPFGDEPQHDDLAEPAPPGFLDGYQTFCGT